jgi:hypothetical protein
MNLKFPRENNRRMYIFLLCIFFLPSISINVYKSIGIPLASAAAAAAAAASAS